jgi:hypothetical protein
MRISESIEGFKGGHSRQREQFHLDIAGNQKPNKKTPPHGFG